MALLETLTDNFDDNSFDTGKWTENETGGGTVTEQNQRLEFACPSFNNSCYVTSATTYDLTGSYIYGKFSFVEGSEEFSLRLEDPSGDLYYARQTEFSQAFWSDTGQLSTNIGPAASGFWWRIRESGNTIFWDTAPNTASDPPISGDWTNRYSETVDAGFDKTAVKVWLTLYNPDTVAQNLRVDGINTGTVAGGATATRKPTASSLLDYIRGKRRILGLHTGISFAQSPIGTTAGASAQVKPKAQTRSRADLVRITPFGRPSSFGSLSTDVVEGAPPPAPADNLFYLILFRRIVRR